MTLPNIRRTPSKRFVRDDGTNNRKDKTESKGEHIIVRHGLLYHLIFYLPFCERAK